MTIDEIRERVEIIRGLSDDPERAHGVEDELHQAVLDAIAKGLCVDPAACAAEALKTLELAFPRWYA